jgi:type I restriction enzyme S subunit
MREMKDSGLPWLRMVPLMWKIRKVKHFYKMQTGFTPSTKNDDFYDELNGKDWVTIGDLCDSRFIPPTTSKHISQKYIDMFNPQVVRRGSLLYSFKLSVGQVAFADRDIYTNEAIASFTADSEDCLRFLFYSSCLIIENANENIYGAKLLNQELIKNAYIVYPPLDEQKKIADYLDSKCSQIDLITEKQKQIIEKLKEYKTSLITEMVTKGLDPNVEMKDSGVDFILKIPANWNVSPIRYLFSLREEKNYKQLKDVNLLSLYTDLGVFPHGEQEERGNKAVTADGYKVVYKDDIVVNIILAWMGAIGISDYNGVTSPAYDVYKPNKNVCSRYYHYLFRTKLFSGECYKYGRGIMEMRWRTYSSEFKSIKVPVPSYDEQHQIADYLDLKCTQIDKTISDRQIAIEKLQEYKKSLIYEVVTGKREV